MPLQADTVRALDDIVARTQASARVPSLAAAVVRDGTLAHVTGAGELPRPDGDTQYRIGSISKTMTAILVLQLRDEGRLALDDPLHKHLPGTGIGTVTIRQLLGHVAGMQREPDGDWWERSAGSDVDTLLAGVTAEKQAWHPLRGYHYSNLAYGVLGAVVSRLTGEDWKAVLGKRLLAPLRMDRTTYQAEQPFARGYVVHPWHGTLREEPRHDAGAMAPAGQIWSTPTDLAKLTTFLYAPDPAVLSAGSMAEMCAPTVIADPDGWTAGYGLGLQLWRRGERVLVGHTGSMPGYVAICIAHRPSRTGVVAFANSYGMHGTSILGLGLSLVDAVLEREPTPVTPWRPGANPPEAVEPLCGRWWWMGREFEVCWDPEARELLMRPIGTISTELWRFTPEGTDRWRGRSGMNDGEILQVRRSRTGAVTALDIATFVFTREAWPVL